METLRTSIAGAETLVDYDADGNPVQVPRHTGPEQRITGLPPEVDDAQASQPTAYGYNQAQQLTRITFPGGGQLDFGYDAAGRVNRMDLARGPVEHTL